LPLLQFQPSYVDQSGKLALETNLITFLWYMHPFWAH